MTSQTNSDEMYMQHKRQLRHPTHHHKTFLIYSFDLANSLVKITPMNEGYSFHRGLIMLKKRLILLASVFGVASPVQAQFFTNFPANPAVLKVGPGQNAGTLNNAATAVQLQTFLGNSVFQAVPTSFVDFGTGGTSTTTGGVRVPT